MVGDVVVLPAVGMGAYGEIVNIESSESSPEQYAYVTTPVPLSALRLVRVSAHALPSISYEAAVQEIQSATSTRFSFTVPDAGTTTPQEQE